MHVASEPHRDPVGENFHHTAQRVPLLGCRFDGVDHPPLDLGVEAAHRGLVDALEVTGPGALRRLGPHRAETDDVTQHRHPEPSQQGLGETARRHPGGGLPGRRPLEDVPGVVESILLHPGQISVARTGLGEDLGGRPRVRGHLLLPFGPLGVGDLDGHRRAQRPTVADPPNQGDLVGLETHPGPPSVPEAPPGELARDLGCRHRQPGGQTLDDHHEGFAVGLSRGEEPEHGVNLLRGPHGPGPRGTGGLRLVHHTVSITQCDGRARERQGCPTAPSPPRRRPGRARRGSSSCDPRPTRPWPRRRPTHRAGRR